MVEPGGARAAGRAVEQQRLADAVRRLIAATVLHVDDVGATAAIAADVDRLAADLETHVPTVVPSQYGAGPGGFDPEALFGYDMVFGALNPVALPLRPRWDGTTASAEAVFTRTYEGPPNCVHGAVIAACFDQVCNVANIGSGLPGFTVDLEVRYRAPTRIGTPVSFEATVDRRVDRDLRTGAVARQGGTVTAEAVGHFRLFE